MNVNLSVTEIRKEVKHLNNGRVTGLEITIEFINCSK